MQKSDFLIKSRAQSCWYQRLIGSSVSLWTQHQFLGTDCLELFVCWDHKAEHTALPTPAGPRFYSYQLSHRPDQITYFFERQTTKFWPRLSHTAVQPMTSCMLLLVSPQHPAPHSSQAVLTPVLCLIQHLFHQPWWKSEYDILFLPCPPNSLALSLC